MEPIELETVEQIEANKGWAITRVFQWKKGETLLLFGREGVASFPSLEMAELVAETMRRSDVEIGTPK